MKNTLRALAIGILLAWMGASAVAGEEDLRLTELKRCLVEQTICPHLLEDWVAVIDRKDFATLDRLLRAHLNVRRRLGSRLNGEPSPPPLPGVSGCGRGGANAYAGLVPVRHQPNPNARTTVRVPA
jgi:hypothetical protein